jgi:hypothetical protein
LPTTNYPITYSKITNQNLLLVAAKIEPWVEPPSKPVPAARNLLPPNLKF